MLIAGESLALIGRNSDASWAKVRLPGGVEGWVEAVFVKTSVPLADIPALETPPLPGACTMTSAIIELSHTGDLGEYDSVLIQVYMTDQDGAGIEGAEVFARSQKSDGNTVDVSGVTNVSGFVFFEPSSTAPGDNTFEITDVQSPGCYFDPGQSQLLLSWVAESPPAPAN